MTQMLDKTGALVEVPDDQVAAAYQAGTHGFASPDTPVPVKLKSGAIGTVPASKAGDAFAKGATVAPADEYHAAVNEARHGGFVGGVEAGAEGLARGATVGLSDPLATGVAGLIGGEQAKAATREHLAGVKEAHPYVAGAGEIAGAAVPVLASGGAAAPEEAAALGAGEAAAGAGEAVAAGGEAAAQSTSKAALLARVLGAPAALVGKAGEAAGGVVESALGQPGAGGALARIARVAAKAGATGAAEGGLFGAGNEISEDTLGDHELNAEKLAASIGHGALYGAMLGGGLGAAGAGAKELGGSILNRIAPSLERQADVEAFKAVHPKLAVTKEAIARAGGEAEVGAVARKYAIFGDSVSDAATSDPETVLGRIKAAQEKVGAQIDATLTSAGEAGAKVKASEVLKPLDEAIARLDETTAGQQKSAPLKAFREQMAGNLGLSTEQVPRTLEERTAFLQDNPGAPPEKAYLKTQIKDADVPLAALTAERRALQANVYQYTRSLTAPLHIEELRKFSGALGDLEEKAMNDATSGVGGSAGTELRARNKDYQRLKLLEKATTERVATQATNQRLSLTDKIMGAGALAGGLASAHPATAAAGIATSLGSKLLREKGNAVASVALGKLAKLDIIARASEAVDSKLGGAINDFADSGARSAKVRLRHFGGATTQEPLQDRYDKASAEPAQAAPNLGMEHVDKVPGLEGFSAHAPKTSIALANTVAQGSAYLAAQRPKVATPPSLLGRTARPSPEQQATFLRVKRAVDDPVGTVTRGLETGKIHTDEIAAIAATKPKLYAQSIQRPALEAAAKHRDTLTYPQIMALSKLAMTPLDPSLTPSAVAYFQTAYANPSGGNPQPKKPPAAPKRKIAGISDASNLHTGTPSQ